MSLRFCSCSVPFTFSGDTVGLLKVHNLINFIRLRNFGGKCRLKLEEEFPGDYLVTPLSFLILSFSFQILSMRIRQILFPLLWLFFLLFVARQFQLLGLMRMERFLAGKPWESWNNSLTKVWLGGLWNKIFMGIFLSTLQCFAFFSGHKAGTRS